MKPFFELGLFSSRRGKGGSKSLTGCKEEKLEDVWNKVLFGLTIIISKSLTDWDIGFEKNSKSCLFINGTPGALQGREGRQKVGQWTKVKERESFWKICIETQKMARTFDGWMEFAVKWDQAVIVENLKTFREKFVEDKHGTERKCLSMTNDL